NVVIIGGGIVGTEAAKMAVGLGAKVTIIDRNLDRLRQLDDIFLSKVQTLASSPYAIEEAISHADLEHFACHKFWSGRADNENGTDNKIGVRDGFLNGVGR